MKGVNVVSLRRIHFAIRMNDHTPADSNSKFPPKTLKKGFSTDLKRLASYRRRSFPKLIRAGVKHDARGGSLKSRVRALHHVGILSNPLVNLRLIQHA